MSAVFQNNQPCIIANSIASLYDVGFKPVDKPYQARVDSWCLLIDASEVRIMIKEFSQRALVQSCNLRDELRRIHATF